MDPRPEIVKGSDPWFVPCEWRDQSNLNNMSISELVSELRCTFLVSDFNRVEEALVAREARLKAEIEQKKREIGSLQEKIEVERLDRVRAECVNEKRVREMCDKLLKVEENSGLDGKIENTGFEVGNRKSELENEKCKLDEREAVDELRNRISKLEDEKKKWVDDRCVIAELRAENRRLVEEKRKAKSLVESWKRKFCELNEQLLVNGDTPSGGNNEGVSGVPFRCNEEMKMIEIDVRGSAPSKRNEDVHLSRMKSPSIPSKDGLGASGGRVGMGTIIAIEDSDEDDCKTMHRKKTTSGIIADNEHPSSSAVVQKKNFATGLAEPIGILKREFASSREFGTSINILDGLDSDTSSSSSSSSSGSLDMDSLPLNSLTSNKKMRTEAASTRSR